MSVAKLSGIAINAGSSSVRLASFQCQGETCEIRTRQRIDQLTAGDAAALLHAHARQTPALVVHRIVHGGARTQPVIVDADVERELDSLSALAPLHNPPALAWVRASRECWPRTLQVAVFDTAFYAQLPAMASTYALPERLRTRYAIKRYGFHGLAHASMWQRWHSAQARPMADAKVISLQLGSGCSITATRNGVAVDTSMGFSPLEGLVMATRGGDIDAGALLHLQRAANMTVDGLEAMLNRESGLRGLAGGSGDMQQLLADDGPAARLAIDVYCYRARKYIGAYAAALGGVDAILFGGGIGEGSAAIRAKILQGLEWCGVELDAAANARASAAHPQAIHRTDAQAIDNRAVSVWVIPVDEEHALAQAAAALLSNRQGETHDASSRNAR